MVVLSIAVLSKSGKILVARQYVDMTRIRIEGILAAFPKLIDADGSASGKQHTYVETGSIRYVYQPIEGLYLVLVTTRGSNIVQDLDTLRLLAKVVPEYATHVTEEDVARNVFDLIFAFDEVIALGYKESITLDAIRTNLEMDSHNEKLHTMVQQSKMNEAKDKAREKAVAIKAAKAANAMTGIGNTPMRPGASGMMGSDAFSGMGSSNGGSGSGFGSAAPPAAPQSTYGLSSASQEAPTKSGMKLGKGLKLGSKQSKSLSVMKQMAEEEGIDASALVQQQSAQAKTAAPGAVVRSDPIEVRISETVHVVYDKDGALHKIEIKGAIQLLCHEEDAKLRLQLSRGAHAEAAAAFNFTPHPNLSKPDFADADALQLKNADKPFPKDKPLGILKWRYAAKEDETMVPLAVTCWPEPNGDGTTTVSMELELKSAHLALRDVVVSVPLNSSEEPEVTAIDGGAHRHNARKHALEWTLPEVSGDAVSAATLEFVVASASESDFFPVSVSFRADDTLCPVTVAEVTRVDTQEPAKFGLYRELQTERYEIVAEAE